MAFLAGCGGRSAPTAPAVGEAPPETTRLRLIQSPSICRAPEYTAEELLRAEGFTDLQYIQSTGAGAEQQRLMAAGEADITQSVGTLFIKQVDTGPPLVMLAGIHTGCYELFGTDQVRAIRDLKGKTVAVGELGSGRHILVATMLLYVGLNPDTDVIWVAQPPAESMQALADGQIDAFMAFPPEPQALRAKQVGHVVVNTALDRPWSQYFCCLLAANPEFVHKHPIATKRALRAILKATDLCAAEPDRTARSLVDRGFAKEYDSTLQALKDVPYNRWREYDPEDTVRFFALRMHEIGMIKSSPDKIIAQGTDWRFFNELKQELKG